MPPPIHPQPSSPSFSVIVPTLNEAVLIAAFMAHLRVRVGRAEIIVVDGGSHDKTAALASAQADRVLHIAPGCARQMNAGADIACGDVLWFLHADSYLPSQPLVLCP